VEPANPSHQEVVSPVRDLKAVEDNTACYLVYEPDSSGRLVEHYSTTPVQNAVGRWVAGGGKKIAKFKLTRNAGRNVLIGNCSAGVQVSMQFLVAGKSSSQLIDQVLTLTLLLASWQGRKNYCNGWCQFVKSAKIMNGKVLLWDPTGKGMTVDVFFYYDDKRSTHQTIRLEQGVAYSTDKLVAVACMPKSTPFFEGMAVDLLKWLSDARDHGYSTEI
jgi:Immune Mapped Protein 2 (IMP2) N-terminal domain